MTEFQLETIIKSANISPCGLYRYRLSRTWDGRPPLTFVMLNPSVADGDVDDPTIRRCMGFARRENAGGVIVINLHAFRATDPSRLRDAADPFGPDNADWCVRTFDETRGAGMPIVAAWGAAGGDYGAERPFLESAARRRARLVCLGRTKSGAPRHPLYVRLDQPLESFP